MGMMSFVKLSVREGQYMLTAVVFEEMFFFLIHFASLMIDL